MIENQPNNQEPADLDFEYDEDTGFPNPETMHTDDIAATQGLLSTANHLSEMESTTGWALLQGFLGEEINAQISNLRRAKTMEEVQRLQSLVDALELLPNIVSKLKFSASQARAALAQYTNTATAG